MGRRNTQPLRSFLPHALAIVIAAAGCLGVAIAARNKVEDWTLTEVRLVLSQTGHDWADVTADGLQLTLLGTAPDEATRFAALSAVGKVVDASRILDRMDVAATADIGAPRFSIEILRNDDGLSLIGLVPAESDPGDIVERARGATSDARIADLLESADFAAPPDWNRALDFGLAALDMLPRSKVSITADSVSVTAVAKDLEDKRRIERALNRDAPPGIALALNISAPRPVITPFTLRFLIDEHGARFDACSADTEAARDSILAAAIEAGVTGNAACTLGLGTPSTEWGDVAARAIRALAAMGRGTLTISNADISLIAAEDTPQPVFDRVVGELEGALPEVFSLNAVRLEPPARDAADTVLPEFVATRAPEGLVQLRGRLGDVATRDAVESFAAAHFGVANVHPATRLADGLPAGWPTRVLTALEALAVLNNGSVRVTPDRVEIAGLSGRKDARAEIARLLSSKLGEGAELDLDVRYVEELDPIAALPTPAECVERINRANAERKITFEPGSTDISPEALDTIDAIAEVLRDCQTVKIEIGGHTDSQGREVMNQQLSQARADAVLNAIMARRVLTSNLIAKGYGESRPIADNKTEEGREANRRIEFRLVSPDAASEDAADAGEAGATEGGTEE